MKRNLIGRVVLTAALLAVITLPASYAAEKQFQTGRILTVEKKFHTRVLYYLVNTPITQDDPYYEISLQLGNMQYLTEFTPRHAADELPDGWIDDTEVQMKFTDKRHVLVRRSGGMDLQLLVLKTIPGSATGASPKTPAVQN